MEHDQSLHKLLARLDEKNLTLNGEKCTFGMSKVVFMDIFLIGPTDEKVRAVKEATRPSSASELRSVLSLVGFSTRFMSDFTTKAEPLRVLCRKDEKFVWGKHKRKLLTR